MFLFIRCEWLYLIIFWGFLLVVVVVGVSVVAFCKKNFFSFEYFVHSIAKLLVVVVVGVVVADKAQSYSLFS